MRFFVISDLHIGETTGNGKAIEQLQSLCRRIRSEFHPNETILFVVAGDVINASKTNAFDNARSCLSCIRNELSDFNVKFEFVPGNHDIPAGDLEPFDRFIAEFGSVYQFSKKSVYANVYDDVNFIFADSNLKRDHREPGEIDILAVNAQKRKGTNILFCHHAFTHNHGGDHDTIENGSGVLQQLEEMGIQFVFHGHTHRSDVTAPQKGVVEIGTGALLKDVSDMDGIQNQFTMGSILNGKLIQVDRFVITKDGGDTFPCETLFPKKKTFADPATINKKLYPEVPNYICRKVLSHETALSGILGHYLAREKGITLKDALLEHKKVLFLSDAGNGKSVELENLVYSLNNSTYFPFLYRLRDYKNKPIAELLPIGYGNILPRNLVLAFDGYDELTAEERRDFEKQLNAYVDEHNEVHIVISSRSNFCNAEKDNESKTFPGFTIYDLCELSRNDSREYLTKQKINPDAFWNEACSRKIEGLLDNAFYLVSVAELFKKEGKLPPKTELMTKLVENSFNTDDAKFPGGLEEQYYSVMETLERIAYSMQLLQTAQIEDRSEYQYLFSLQERNLAKYSGLLIREGTKWRFQHNNFREYLTAKYLTRLPAQEVISHISNAGGIKPSWVNTLGYLTGLELSWDLIGWIAETEPTALVKFEPDRVTEDMRFDIFKRLFLYYEERNIRFEDDLCDVEELARFSKGFKTIEFLVDRIVNPINEASQHTAVDLLRHCEHMYGLDLKIKECLLTCCKNYPKTSKYTCRLAVFALYQTGVHTSEVTEALMDLYGESDVDYLRLAMYEYLVATKEHNRYVKFFLDGIKYIVSDSGWNSDRIGNELSSLVEGLKTMSTCDSVSAVLFWFAGKDRGHFHSADKVFPEIINQAVRLYQAGATELYSCVLQCAIKQLREYGHEMLKECMRFFEQTSTLKTATIDLLNIFKDDIYPISSFLYLNSKTEAYVFEAYSEGSFSDVEAFRIIAARYIENDNLYNACSKLLYERTGSELPKRGAKIDYAAIRRENAQKSFDALFSLEKSEELVQELLKEIGRADICAGELLDHNIEISSHSPLFGMKVVIYHNSNKGELVSDFFKNRDFDLYTLFQCQKTLNHKTEVVISEKQRKHIEQLVYRYINRNVLKECVTYSEGSVHISNLAYVVVFLAQYFDFELPEDALLDATLIPSFFFAEEKDNAKYEYLKKHLPLDLLKYKIAKNLEIPDLNGSILREHIDLCKTQKWDFATEAALRICVDNSCDESTRYSGLEFLYSMYGATFIKDSILEHVTGSFLNTIASKCEGIPVDDLRLAFEREYTRNPSNEFLTSLITYGSELGIRKYVDNVRETHRVLEKDSYPDSPTRAISSIKDPKYLPLLGELLELVFAPDFVDSKFWGLRSSLNKALGNCGRNDSEATIDLIERYLDKLKDNKDAVQFCNYTIEDIKRDTRKDGDKPKTLYEIKCEIEKNKSDGCDSISRTSKKECLWHRIWGAIKGWFS